MDRAYLLVPLHLSGTDDNATVSVQGNLSEPWTFFTHSQRHTMHMTFYDEYQRRLQYSPISFGSRDSVRSYITFYAAGAAILIAVLLLICLFFRLIRFLTRDSSTMREQNSQTVNALDIEFNQKIQSARENSIETVLPIEVCKD
jgi:hypothetical protein